MKQQKKKRFFTFIYSLIPGAAEMYMGFMKKGLSIMAIFCLSCVLPVLIGEVFLLAVCVVWFYSFFHAGNLAACEDEIFYQLPDSYIWEEFLEGRELHVSLPGKTVRKWFAAALIWFGVILFWENISGMVLACIPNELWDEWYPIMNMISNKVPEMVVSLLLIAAGIYLIKGKKESLNGEEK